MAPASLEEALALRAERGDEATVLAGGTFLGILMNQGFLSPTAFLSLGAVPELREMGVEIQDVEDGLRVRVDEPSSLGSVDVATLPFPGFATDLQAQMMVLLTQTSGTGIITENVYENRLQVAEELNRLNAGIDLFGGHRALVRGPRRLSGTIVQSPDLRGGAALVMAGLDAEGTTIVDGARHILRGYEGLEGKLTSLGATVALGEEAALWR